MSSPRSPAARLQVVRPAQDPVVRTSGGRSSELSDEALIAAVVRGDSTIARALYDRLVHAIDHTLYRVLGRRESDHEDLIQATFEQVIKTLALRRFAGACSLRSWACSVATHIGFNALRSRRRERGLFDHRIEPPLTSVAAPDDPERDTAVRNELAQLRGLFARLSPGRAEALFLHDVLGYDLAEIAALTGTSLAAAQSRLVRGRHELVERFEALERGGDR